MPGFPVVGENPMKKMTVELKKLLEDVNEDAVVVVGAPDHNYQLVSVCEATALTNGHAVWEDHYSTLHDGERRISVLVVG